MTTLRQIIIDAFRQSNLVAAGETPEASEFDEALRKLTSFISGVYGYEIGEPLKPLNFGSKNLTNPFGRREDLESFIKNSYVPSNVRLMVHNENAAILYLDPSPEDGALFGLIDVANNLQVSPITLNGNGRNIEGFSSTTLATNGVNKEWFYRADLGNWLPITDLEANSLMPFPEEFDEYFTMSLAMRLNPAYGIQTNPETMSILNRALSRLRTKYRQRNNTPLPLALERMDNTTFGFFDKAFELGITR